MPKFVDMNRSADPLIFLKLLAHDLRWSLVGELAITDLRVGELVDIVDQPTNLVSYHLRQLRDGNLVVARRSSADGRDVYYTLNHRVIKEGFHAAQQFTGVCAVQPQPTAPLRVLFVCTHNSARSQMAEGLLRAAAGDAVEVYSAGNSPTSIKADAIAAMDALGVDISEQTTNHLNENLNVPLDYVITVCDRAREVCPVFNTKARVLHWGITPPSAQSKPEESMKAYREAATSLQSRIDYFLSYANLMES